MQINLSNKTRQLMKNLTPEGRTIVLNLMKKVVKAKVEMMATSRQALKNLSNVEFSNTDSSNE